MTAEFHALLEAERADALAEADAARKARTDASEVIAQFVSGLQKQGHTLEDIARNFGIDSAKVNYPATSSRAWCRKAPGSAAWD